MWVRVARSIFAYRCGFLMCNKAKLWTPRGGGRWPEQKLPNCEVTQLPSWERTMKSPGFLILPSLSQPEPEPSSCLSSVAYDTPCFMWRTKTRVKTEDIYLNVDFTRGFLLNLNVKEHWLFCFQQFSKDDKAAPYEVDSASSMTPKENNQ